MLWGGLHGRILMLMLFLNTCYNTCYSIHATLLKKRLTQLPSCEFCEIFKNTFRYGKPPVVASVLYMNIDMNNLQYTKESF